ncbi:MAG: alpha-ketoacid dehydrogenase subunit beta [Planctomycetes bacterium]|nr:alpha-ketoacid dehydrogenase subunit beta [Planctomycetota bacterium]
MTETTAAPAVEPRLYVDLITEALRDEMRADDTVYVMGQDVAEFGGAFNITMGFLEEFGPARIFNTPIAESGTVGMAVGSALLGRRPVVEMQFADFVTCGFNQLVNVAAKMHYRMLRPVPMVIRLPSGGGVGAGAFHSQNIEAYFAHTPGLKVVAPATAEDAYLLLRQAIRDPNPVLYFEHKYLYRRQKAAKPVFPLGDTAASIPLEPEAAVRRPGRDVTIVTYGWMVHRSLEAAEVLAKDGIDIEVIDLRVLQPLDDATVFASIEKTNRVVVVHEATMTCGIGAEDRAGGSRSGGLVESA